MRQATRLEDEEVRRTHCLIAALGAVVLAVVLCCAWDADLPAQGNPASEPVAWEPTP